MAELHREEAFGKDRSKYFWCLHCARAYERSEFRQVGKLQMCPYADCSGDTVIDAWEWNSIRRANPAYPRVPKRGVRYAMYRDEKIIEEEFARYRETARREAGLMTQANAASVLNLSQQRVNDLVQSCRLHWHEFFDTKFLSCREIADFRKVKRKPGRPFKTTEGLSSGMGNGDETSATE
jgi:hypothetical protein